MFGRASKFNGDLSLWDVSQVQNMYAMFYEASSFNQDISLWNVSQVQDMSIMFTGASSFNQDLCAWPTRTSLTPGQHASFYIQVAHTKVLHRLIKEDHFALPIAIRGTSSTIRK
jgi:surface protein